MRSTPRRTPTRSAGSKPRRPSPSRWTPSAPTHPWQSSTSGPGPPGSRARCSSAASPTSPPWTSPTTASRRPAANSAQTPTRSYGWSQTCWPGRLAAGTTSGTTERSSTSSPPQRNSGVTSTTARAALHPGATMIIATFADDGPEQCSGLPVACYSPTQLVDTLNTHSGAAFELIDRRREEHRTPWGSIQPFTWCALSTRASMQRGRSRLWTPTAPRTPEPGPSKSCADCPIRCRLDQSTAGTLEIV